MQKKSEKKTLKFNAQVNGVFVKAKTADKPELKIFPIKGAKNG